MGPAYCVRPNGRLAWLKLCCWHGTHLAFAIALSFISVLTKLTCAFSTPLRPSPDRLPSRIAIAIDSQDASNHLLRVASLLRQLAHLDVRHVSLYDMEGALKSSLSDLVDALGGSNAVVQFYSADMVAPLESNVEFGFAKRMAVEVLSLHDGKDTLVEAAKHVCLKSLKSGAHQLASLKEEDIDASLKQIRGAGPDPDLLLLFSRRKCLLGFPPWRLRLTEILYMGSIQNMTQKSLLKALYEFSTKQHRYGK